MPAQLHRFVPAIIMYELVRLFCPIHHHAYKGPTSAAASPPYPYFCQYMTQADAVLKKVDAPANQRRRPASHLRLGVDSA
jgi:hypothetical protein